VYAQGAYRHVSAASISARLRAGKAVVLNHADIQGTLRLPSVVDTPLILRQSRFSAPVLGAHSSFRSIVDFSTSIFASDINFYDASFTRPFLFTGVTSGRNRVTFAFASFAGPALFARSSFDGPVSFRGAAFLGGSNFSAAGFADLARFSLASFNQSTDFSTTRFYSTTPFVNADFRSLAEFDSAFFHGHATFAFAHFSQLADFANTTFQPLSRRVACPSFERARFDGSANFSHASFIGCGASFYNIRAAQDVDFADVIAEKAMDFTSARLLGSASFARADLRFVSFDQASIDLLDLEAASIAGLRLPATATGSGRLGGLRLSVNDVDAIEGNDARGAVGAQERALGLIEATARSANDLQTANAAKVRRLSLERDAKAPLPKAFDWIVWWGVLGYLVQPIHPLVAIAIVFGIAVAARAAQRRSIRQLGAAIRDSLSLLLRLTPPNDGWRQVEYVVFKFLVVVFLVNVGNVWPPARELIEGVF
jgi:hypothetical protein